MKQQQSTIVENSLIEYTKKVIALTKAGYDMDPDNPETAASQQGFAFTVTMERDPTAEQLEKDRTEAAKPTRAEIMANARAVRAANAAARKKEE